ncbi:hypothetical protein M885DRAFT_520202, partial [Pelagophyceae sp. CCMP2097]|mmetsp:Transcript_33967/g.116901  ORF Transcript_33967/g.116901 Transcript_33967/m.116901 type:complete len:613 (+) Transcript_33967:1-1839(+)
MFCFGGACAPGPARPPPRRTNGGPRTAVEAFAHDAPATRASFSAATKATKCVDVAEPVTVSAASREAAPLWAVFVALLAALLILKRSNSATLCGAGGIALGLAAGKVARWVGSALSDGRAPKVGATAVEGAEDASAPPRTADAGVPAAAPGEYAAAMRQCVELLEASHADPAAAGWDRWGVKKGVEIYLKIDPATGVKNSLGVKEIAAPLEALVQCVDERETKKSYDKQWLRDTELARYDATLLDDQSHAYRWWKLQRCEYKAVFPTQARDCVVVAASVACNGPAARGHACCIVSVESDVAGAECDGAYVRMHVQCGGYFFEALGPERTLVTTLAMLDPKGSIPTAVINFVAFDIPMKLARLEATPRVLQRGLWLAAPLAAESPPAADALAERCTDAISRAADVLCAVSTDPRRHGFLAAAAPDASLRGWVREEDGYHYTLSRGVVEGAARDVLRALDDHPRAFNRVFHSSAKLGDVAPTRRRMGSTDFSFAAEAPLAATLVRCKKLPLIMAAQDTIQLRALGETADGRLVRVVASLEDHPQAPARGSVDAGRATILAGGVLLQPVAGGVQVTLLSMVRTEKPVVAALSKKAAAQRLGHINVIRALLRESRN